MLKTEVRAARTVAHLVAGGALMLVIGAAGTSQAQGPAPAPAQGQPQGPARGRGPGIQLPRQGFEATGQNPANYTPEEKAAVAVVEKWIDAITQEDTAAQMALIDDNIVYRTDPAEPLGHGARNYCAIGPGLDVPEKGTTSTLQELYVVGGRDETQVLLRRQDLSPPSERNLNFLGGYAHPFAVLLRIRNGKIVEFYDVPTDKVSQEALPFRVGGAGGGPGGGPGGPGGAPGGPGRRIPARCEKYPEASSAAQQPAALPAHALNYSYGTAKAEYFFNPFEASAARAVRGWFAAWKAGDPLLLASFVDRNVIFRPNSAADLGHGRDDLLKRVCGNIGGRLNLTGLFAIGGDFATTVITKWDKVDAGGQRTRMSSFFRVQNGLIVEWMDTALDPAPPTAAANQNSEACQAVNAALAQPAGR